MTPSATTTSSASNDDWTDTTIELSGRSAPGPWWIEGVDGVHSVGCLLEPGGTLVVGSARGWVDLCIEDRSVSSRHCRLEGTRDGVLVSDLGSTNGVYCGSGRVDRVLLADGGAVALGRTTVLVSAPNNEDARPDWRPVPGLVGDSAPMRRLAVEIHRAARLRGAVLIQGESGTGKDLVARALHQLSGRPGDYVPINVGAIPEGLVDAELFGHARGAFTGAVAARIGAFEQANRGTLFLDEVADLSPAGQVRLLRVVEDGQVRAVGTVQATPVDVRIVSASCVSLLERIEVGHFRNDLYHRLSTFEIHLPPLRDRRGDVPVLTRALLERYREELGPRHLAPRAMLALLAHDWPGNVRELASVLYRAAARTDGIEIDLAHLDLGVTAVCNRATMVSPTMAVRAVAQHGGNTSAAARSLGIPRSTLRGWLARGRPGPG
ncbi:MAG: sigma 54-dependent Fis family transcriptional regulator [Polyangiaceae bacterium]|nr:sigma 54-dependent Fis family transcriptional regulator [Polyangiaceae bacterium]